MSRLIALVRIRSAIASVAFATALFAGPAVAGDFGAVVPLGNWNAGSTWTGNTVPGASDNVYIGSTYPGGAVSTATVLLTQNQSASSVYLGVEGGAAGTLDLGNFQLTASYLSLGTSGGGGGTGTVVRGASGTLTITNAITIDGLSTLSFAAGDTAGGLTLTNGAQATTAATGNLTGGVNVDGAGSKLTLTSAMNLGANGSLNVANGGTVDFGGANLTAGYVYLGFYGAGATLQNRGVLTASSTLYLGNSQAFTFGTSDSAANLYMVGGSSATTTAVGNLTASVYLDGASTLTLGAALNLGTGSVDVRTGTVNAQGHAITAGSVYVGWYAGPGQLINKGALSITSLYVAGQSLDLAAGDAVTNFYLAGGSTTLPAGVAVSYLDLSAGALATVPAGGVTSAAAVGGAGSKLTLTGALNLGASGSLNVYDGGAVDFGGQNLTAGSIFLGFYGAGATLQNRGVLTASSYLYLGNNQVFAFGASDSAVNMYIVGGSSVTTAAAGNITSSVYLDGASTLTLGAALNLGTGGSLDIRNGTVNAQGNAITAGSVYVGWYAGPGQLINKGTLTATNLSVAGQSLDLAAGDAVTNFYLAGGSTTLPAGVAVSYLDLSAGALATVPAGGVTSAAAVGGAGSKLTLTGALNLGTNGSLNVYDGGAVDFGGQNLTAGSIFLGYYGFGATLQNRGAITASSYLYLGNNQVFAFGASDSTPNLYMVGGSSATTTAAGNITNSVYVDGGGTLTLGAALNLGTNGSVDVRSGTVNAQGHAITAGTVYVGWYAGPGQITNKGPLTVTNLYVANQTFNLAAGDSVTSFTLSNGSTILPAGVAVADLQLLAGSTATVSAGGITNSAAVDGAGSRLTLTSSLDFGPSGSLNVATGGTVDFGGANLTAGYFYLGFYGAGATLQNRGVLTATNYVFLGNGQAFTFGASDSTPNLYMVGGSSATTTAAGNITSSVYANGSTLILGAPLNVGSGGVDALNGAVVNAQGHAITAGTVTIGSNSTSNGTVLQNAGPITTGPFGIGKQSQATLIAGDSTVGTVTIADGSTLTVSHAGGRTAKLTITDPAAAALAIDSTSTLVFDLDGTHQATVLQWANPQGFDHITYVNSLIAANKIQFNLTNGAQVFVYADTNFTYLSQPVPEPVTTLLAGFGLLTAGYGVRRRLKRDRVDAASSALLS